MSETTLRCKRCDYWLGESAVPVIVVALVKRSEEVTISAPRDLRICGGCKSVNVLVPIAEIDKLRAAVVA
jgi:hypothetical protein